jgi:hypothetical protein
MLLLTRRFREFLGLSAGVATLVLVSTALSGVEIWRAYAHFLTLFGEASGLTGGQSVLYRWQFVDLNSLTYAIPWGRSFAGFAVLFCVAGASALCLALLLWKSATGCRAVQDLAWAATLTWTVLLNLYTPTYDSVLVIVSVILTLEALRVLQWTEDTRWVVLLTLLMLIVARISEPIAKTHGIQLLTLVLVILGLVQLFHLRRAVGQLDAERLRT